MGRLALLLKACAPPAAAAMAATAQSAINLFIIELSRVSAVARVGAAPPFYQ